MRAARWPLVAGLVLPMAVFTPAPASAGITVLCTGHGGCGLFGKSDAGYGPVSSTEYWGMTPGHNCTNYIAYRLTHGRLVSRPAGTGSAGTWGPAARAAGVPVNDVPVVGAIAWWAADLAPAGPSGHVGYVESVSSDGSSFTMSDDSLNGDFHWRRISRGGTGWPSGFIHYPESDGSPVGSFTEVTSPSPGIIDFWGTASDPDHLGPSLDYLVTLGGPREDSSAEKFWFSSPYQRFHQIRQVGTRGTTEMYLYAANAASTAGKDALLGRRTVTVRSPSSTNAALTDATITKATSPRVSIAVRSGTPVGTLVVKRGTTTLKTFTLTTVRAGKVTLILPRQTRGTKYLKVYYRGSTRHVPSHSSTLTLKVR